MAALMSRKVRGRITCSRRAVYDHQTTAKAIKAAGPQDVAGWWSFPIREAHGRRSGLYGYDLAAPWRNVVDFCSGFGRSTLFIVCALVGKVKKGERKQFVHVRDQNNFKPPARGLRQQANRRFTVTRQDHGFNPARRAASSFSSIPPTGRTRPCSVSSPVIATPCRTAMPDKRLVSNRYGDTCRRTVFGNRTLRNVDVNFTGLTLDAAITQPRPRKA